MNYEMQQESDKMHSLDRVIVLKPIEGLTPLTGTGAPDKTLFSGENNLHAIYDATYGLWAMKYDRGTLPGGLEGKFTDLALLVEHVRQYFARRNVEIVEVRD